MPTTVNLTAGTLAVGFCPATYQAMLDAFVLAMSAEVPGNYNSFNYGSAVPDPADRDKPWVEVDANGHIVSISNWNTVLGVWDPYDGRPTMATTTNVANAYTAVINDRSIVSDAQGHLLYFVLEINAANTGAATLTIDAPTFNIGPYAINKNFNDALISGDLQANQIVLVAFSDTTNTFQLLNPAFQSTSDSISYALLQYRVAAGTAATSYGVGTATLPINTEVLDPDGVVTLAANQFTLTAGRWDIHIAIPMGTNNAAPADLGQIFIWDVTGGAIVTNGSGSEANQSIAINNTEDSTNVTLDWFLNIAAPNTYELRLQVGQDVLVVGVAAANTGGHQEVYTSVKLLKYPT